MAAFDYRLLTRNQIADELAAADIAESRALPGATLYDLQAGPRHWLLVALPDGTGIAVDLARPSPRRRRDNDQPA